MALLVGKGRNQFSLVSTGIEGHTLLISTSTKLLKRGSQVTDTVDPAILLQEKWPQKAVCRWRPGGHCLNGKSA